MGRIIVGALVILVALFGLRQFSQSQKGDEAPAAGGEVAASMELISYITHGDEVDVNAFVPAEGYAIVEFTADW
ncbi:MAG: hypothetical protein R3E97_14210 [Candidatus Eisenbacteria bacterium]